MDLGDWASLGSTIIAAIALGTSAWLSYRAARAAETSANAAAESVETAKQQAALAAESVQLARAEQHAARAPDFALRPQAPWGNVWTVEVEMTAGPPAITMEVWWWGQAVAPRLDSHLGREKFTGTFNETIEAVKGNKFLITDYTVEDPTYCVLKVMFECREAGEPTAKPWTVIREVHWQASSD